MKGKICVHVYISDCETKNLRFACFCITRHVSRKGETISENGNKTTSILTYLPEIEDNGVQIVCRAENIRLKESHLDDHIYLDVYYAPIVKLLLRTENNIEFVKENDRIHFDCRVNAKPNVTEYIWSRNGHLLTNDLHKVQSMQYLPLFTLNPFVRSIVGIEINNSKLYIHSMQREQSGNYQCSTRNIIGKGESEPYHLKSYCKYSLNEFAICITHHSSKP
ncbi:hemicentin-1-like protein [Leptotrombidium deliense]|uniref:Hemicentin-1-like protein n=1 Tax=Leptotrombidium deliense TaxID=299467 RepID=A0A443SW19_9ACAR|nr:hemicentin-1-like protein [Leptotrombidium deliense]